MIAKFFGSLQKRFTRSILKGIERIHREAFVHCDIKLENVLLVEDESSYAYMAKVADLGLVKSSGSREKCGTAGYWAPEVARLGTQGQVSDIWALGCVVFGMLRGRLLWANHGDLSDDDITRVIAYQSPTLPCGVFYKAAEDFLRKCFRCSPGRRPTAAELLRDLFLRREHGLESDDNDGDQRLLQSEDLDFIPIGNSSSDDDDDYYSNDGFEEERMKPSALMIGHGGDELQLTTANCDKLVITLLPIYSFL